MTVPITLPDAGDPTAVVGRRVGAALIDVVVVVAPSGFVLSSRLESYDISDTGLTGSEYCDEFTDRIGGVCMSADDTAYYIKDGGGTADLLLVGLTIGMFVVLQGLTGWTVGKRLLGIRCVRADGSRPGIGRAAARWLLWIVDALPCIPLVGFITSLTTVGHRRVGDMVASTYVVRADAAGRPVSIPVGSSVPPVVSPTGADWPAPSAPQFPAPTAKPGPQWDEARGTYIQWDPDQQAWVQWDDAAKQWGPIR